MSTSLSRCTRLLLPLLLPLLLLAAALAAAQELPVAEAPLDPEGAAYELALAPDGALWLTDFGAGTLWRVDRTTGEYVVFGGFSAPSDAHAAPDGSVWFGELDQGRLGRLLPGSGAISWWPMPDAGGIYGVAPDAFGRVWALAADAPRLYRLDPADRQLCSYALPDDGIGEYLLVRDGAVWLGDWVNERLLRLEPAVGVLTRWTLPAGAGPRGLTFDTAGALWWADTGRGMIGRLEPASGRLTHYDPPRGDLPQAVAFSAGGLWYSEHLARSLGRLDPLLAVGSVSTPDVMTRTLAPACITASPVATATATVVSGTLSWEGAAYTPLFLGGDWNIFELPASALPDGLLSDGTHLWLTDPGRQRLIRLPVGVAIEACVLADADGSAATAGDRTPLLGWALALLVDGSPPPLIRESDAAGCARWADLAPGLLYEAEVLLPPGWIPLGSTTASVPPPEAGTLVTATFVVHLPDYDAYLYLPQTSRRPAP